MTKPNRKKPQPTTPEELVLSAACSAFGDSASALSWLSQPNLALGGTSPMQCVAASGDTSKVLQLLGRLAHGVHS